MLIKKLSLLFLFTLLFNFAARADSCENIFFKTAESIRASVALNSAQSEVPAPEVSNYFPATNFTSLKNKSNSSDDNASENYFQLNYFRIYSSLSQKLFLTFPVYLLNNVFRI